MWEVGSTECPRQGMHGSEQGRQADQKELQPLVLAEFTQISVQKLVKLHLPTFRLTPDEYSRISRCLNLIVYRAVIKFSHKIRIAFLISKWKPVSMIPSTHVLAMSYAH